MSPKQLEQECQQARMLQTQSGQHVLQAPSREKLALYHRYKTNRLRPEDIHEG